MPLRSLLVLVACVLNAGVGGGARAQDAVRLTIGAEPGQTARLTALLDAGILIFAGGDPLTLQLHNETAQGATALAADADGTVTWQLRLLKATFEQDGEPLLRYDVEDPGRNRVPQGSALDQLQVTVQQESDGRIRDFDVQGGAPQMRAAVEKALEDSIEKSVLVVPRTPVTIGQSWDVGRRTIPLSGIGRVEYRLLATLVGISNADSGTQADVRLDAADARFVPDADSKLAGKLSSFRLQGDAHYDVGGRYLRSQDTYGFVSVVAPNPEGGGMMTMQMYVRVGSHEERDEPASAVEPMENEEEKPQEELEQPEEQEEEQQ